MTDQLTRAVDAAVDADRPADRSADRSADLAARADAGPPTAAAVPPAAAAAEEVRLVSEGVVDGVELFTWYDGEGRVLAEHTPLDPTLKQCGC